ncbi:MAG: acyltransferase [Acidobacteriota bacterium]
MGRLPPRPHAPRYESLDTWRGLACLLVLVNHGVFYNAALPSIAPAWLGHINALIATVAARCWAGVPVFFVISGYCISATVDSHRRKRTSVPTYFLKRFRRIFPPYWVVLFGTALVIGVGDVLGSGVITRNSGLLRPWWYSPAQWAGSITLTEIWRYHLVGGGKGLFLGHAWTLCYEEQFYAVTGALLWLCPRRFFLGAALVTVAVALTVVAASHADIAIDGFFFDGGWIQFALGILLYYALNYTSRPGQWAAAAVFGLVVAAALSRGSALLAVDKNDAQAYLVAGLFALTALVLRPFDQDAVQSRVLQPIRWCGLMCYSLYLVHLPVTNLIRAALGAAGVVTGALSPFISLPLCGIPSIWLAWRFHLAVERKFMNSPSPGAVARPA